MRIILSCIVSLCFPALLCAEEIIVGVTIPPQKYFVEAIAEKTVKVVVLIPAGADPHSFEASAKSIMQISKAKIFFTIGIGLEEQALKRIQNITKDITFVPSYVEIPRVFSLQNKKETTNIQFKEGENGEFIPVNQHVWTSPMAVMVIIERIRDTLSSQYPQHAKLYKKNADKLIQKVEALDSSIRESLAEKKQRSFISYHPVWKYFANEYKLKEIAIEENEREPSAKALASIIARSKRDAVQILISQPQFSAKLVYIVAGELSIPVVSINPLAENWFQTMRTLQETLIRFLR